MLTQHNISSGEVKLTAVNRYEIVIPWPHIEKSVPIIANRMNDEPYPVREKGPLWLIFPFDDDSRYRTYEISAMSIWQLIRIEVN